MVSDQVVFLFTPSAGDFSVTTLNEAEATITVWSNGMGSYFKGMFSSFLHHAFPAARGIVWTHNESEFLAPATLPIGILSHFWWEEDAPMPALVPMILWSAENNRVVWPGYPPAACIISSFAPGEHEADDLFIPQAMLRSLPAGTPLSVRLYDDDITQRPLSVMYVNRHCTVQREEMFHRLLAALGPQQARARSRCSANDAPIPGDWSVDALLEALSQAKFVIAMENIDLPGYASEKIINAFLAGAIPIYWGGGEVLRHMLNPAAYIRVEDYGSIAEAAADVLAILADPPRLAAMRAQPISHNLPWLYERLRWDVNNASAYDAEVAQIKHGLLAAWAARLVPLNTTTVVP